MKFKRVTAALLIIAAMLVLVIPASAASGSAYISVSVGNPSIGDSITVYISVSSDGYIFGFEGDLSYNSSVLQYDGGSDSSGGGGNAHFVVAADSESETSIGTSISFKAIAAGDSGLSVTISGAYDPNINAISVSGTSASVTVAGGSSGTSESEREPERHEESQEESKEEEKKPEVTVEINKVKYRIWDDLEGVELPDGYGPHVFNYNDTECLGAIESGSSTIIAYLENVETKKSSFFVFNTHDGTFLPFAPVKSMASTYVQYPLSDGLTVPEIFDIEVDNFGTAGIPAWESSDSRLANLVLFYGTDAKGIKGFYLYDKDNGSVSRFMYMNFLPEEKPEENDEPETEPTVTDAAQSLYAKILEDQRIFIIIAVLAALSIGLLIALICSIAFKKVSRVDKEKFRKKMEKKKNRVTKRAEKYMSGGDTETPELEIETENFDEIPTDDSGDIVIDVTDEEE